ncbi:MAG: hypothetical protein U1E66_10425 [Rhodospirillales bacterium]
MVRRRCIPLCAALLVAPVLALGTVGGCIPVRYEYTDPATVEGRTCADRCIGTRQTCEGRTRIVNQQCHARYEVQMVQYTLCQQNPRRPLCLSPDPCPDPDNAQCILDYNKCFTACGGQIKEIPLD